LIFKSKRYPAAITGKVMQNDRMVRRIFAIWNKVRFWR
jgi:hypothetical protein